MPFPSPSLPPYVVPLGHPTWEEAVQCARSLPPEALPELRLDLFPDQDPGEGVESLRRPCLVTCRRLSEGGAWAGSEGERLKHLLAALPGRPAWLDLEWDLGIPDVLQRERSHTRLLRSVHVEPGVFDLEQRLRDLPEGDAFKWVGLASRLADNARLWEPLAWARDHGLALSAFLWGPKGLPSRCLQFAKGGRFTYAAPDDGPPVAPGQLPLALMRAWRCHKLRSSTALCGVLGQPVLHSRGPAFHNARFQAAFKDLLYLPLEVGDATEALEALEALELLGASLTAPLKEQLPELLGLRGPLNTLWRRHGRASWSGANTDLEALQEAMADLPKGPVLLLGDGGVAATSRLALEAAGFSVLQSARRFQATPAEVAQAAPVGTIQATSLGMSVGDPRPFPELLDAALPTLRWGVEWIYKENTAFATWVKEKELRLVDGLSLFEAQARGQSEHYVRECGE